MELTSANNANMYLMSYTDGGKSITLSEFRKCHFSGVPKQAFFVALQATGILQNRGNGSYKINHDPHKIFTKRNNTVGVSLAKVGVFERVYGKHVKTACNMYKLMKQEVA